MRMKLENEWSDKSMQELCGYIGDMLHPQHKYPIDFGRKKKLCREIDLGYETIDACE